MGRSKSLLSGGEEKTCREGEKGKRRVDLSLLFSQAPGDFLIDFQGYVSNLFFRYGGLMNESVSPCFSSNFPKFGPVWNVCIQSPWPPPPLPPPPSPLLCSFSPLSPLEKKEGGDIYPKKSMYFQTGCLCWQHRSLATIKKFALPDRLFLF